MTARRGRKKSQRLRPPPPAIAPRRLMLIAISASKKAQPITRRKKEKRSGACRSPGPCAKHARSGVTFLLLRAPPFARRKPVTISSKMKRAKDSGARSRGPAQVVPLGAGSCDIEQTSATRPFCGQSSAPSSNLGKGEGAERKLRDGRRRDRRRDARCLPASIAALRSLSPGEAARDARAAAVAVAAQIEKKRKLS